MTTVKEFKEWLDRFPDDTIVEFGIQQPADLWEAYGSVVFESPKLQDNDYGDGWEFVDFRDNQFVRPEDDHFGKMYLKIGESS